MTHYNFMLMISALFLLVSALLIISLFRHHRASGQSVARFAGPTGSVQLLWALVPVAILGYINYELMTLPEDRIATAPGKIALAASETSSSAQPETKALR